jgi:hypothetical protein
MSASISVPSDVPTTLGLPFSFVFNLAKILVSPKNSPVP